MKVLLPPQYACFPLRTSQIRQWKKEKIFYPGHNNFGLVYNQQIETNFILKRNVLFLSQNSERAGLKSIKHTL